MARQKAGSIEAAHDVIKNDLAGGVMSSKHLGANAAWLRRAVLTFDLLTALKRLVLSPELVAARPTGCAFSSSPRPASSSTTCGAMAGFCARLCASFDPGILALNTLCASL